jgi:hypothetical protein
MNQVYSITFTISLFPVTCEGQEVMVKERVTISIIIISIIITTTVDLQSL